METQAVIAYELNPPVEMRGQLMATLEDAAYFVRKFAIEADDADARRLVRLMRDAETAQEALEAESRLRAWVITVIAKNYLPPSQPSGHHEQPLHHGRGAPRNPDPQRRASSA